MPEHQPLDFLRFLLELPSVVGSMCFVFRKYKADPNSKGSAIICSCVPPVVVASGG